ncbi:hypothetical protein [uncultured Tateyamaria sp.]|uniref:hypothetical protein n=1 Tax=uncultured Tateyamaria sp. TaxID=455651 RepID=UPI00260AEDDA|nr:hypothetical protein [uncultured Tateyamaria sp.]
MTNTEVEDVLASIRRLVSDDNRPESQEKSAVASDRLVLTPALRVMDDAAPNKNDTAERDDIAQDVHAQAEAVPAFDVTEDTSREDADVSDEEAQLDAMSEDAAEEVRHEPDAASDYDEGEPITLDTVDLDQDTLMSIQDAFADIDKDEATDAAPVPESDRTSDANTLSDKIAALETLIAGQTGEFEPDMAGDGENAGTEAPTLEWEDADEDDLVDAAPEMATPDQHPPVGAAPDEAQIFSSDEDVLDEDALRDLVSDIVREELQGALGERITRNVRKLVRREIHRALAAQDLE